MFHFNRLYRFWQRRWMSSTVCRSILTHLANSHTHTHTNPTYIWSFSRGYTQNAKPVSLSFEHLAVDMATVICIYALLFSLMEQAIYIYLYIYGSSWTFALEWFWQRLAILFTALYIYMPIHSEHIYQRCQLRLPAEIRFMAKSRLDFILIDWHI